MSATTPSVASALVVVPMSLPTTTENLAPFAARETAGTVNEAEVAPEMGTPLLRHCHEVASLSRVVTPKETGRPSMTVWEAGCCAIRGGVAGMRIR